MEQVIVLGAGLVGKAIALDLSADYSVTAVDSDPDCLTNLAKQGIRTIQADLSSSTNVKDIVHQTDLVIGAVPGHMGFKTVKSVIEAGKNIVDISFFPEDAFDLDHLARNNGVIACVDCGVAPGMSNLVLGYHSKAMQIERFTCYVGGLPKIRSWPFEYKAPFSPIDVLEEYTRPARFVENGKLVIKEALSDPEPIEFEGIGTLEAFNTDGLRSLLKTMEIPNMIEKTLRFPGHIELMKVFRETGFFSEEPIQIGEAQIRPIDVTTQLLFPKWKLKPDDEEFTVMRMIVEGTEQDKKKIYSYNLLDRFDIDTGVSSMARTTGYTCTAIANLVLKEKFTHSGIHPPELIGDNDSCFHFVMQYLRERGVNYQVASEPGI